MPNWVKYGIAGSVLWLIATWVLGHFGAGLNRWYFDLLLISVWMEHFSLTKTIIAVFSTRTTMAVIIGWIAVWVVCWAVFKGKDK